MTMPDHSARLNTIAAWLQQADDELLYTPDVGAFAGADQVVITVDGQVDAGATIAVDGTVTLSSAPPEGLFTLGVTWRDEALPQAAIDWAAGADRTVISPVVGRVVAVHADGRLSVRLGDGS